MKSISGQSVERAGTVPATRPVRLGFLGLGWIGRHRLRAAADHPRATVVAMADPSPEALQAAGEIAADAAGVHTFKELLQQDLDGVVIATPSALHCEQACAALRHGLAVYCQKPLARTAAETRRVLREAAAADRLLAVDYCYRAVAGMEEMHQRIGDGALGRLFHVDLTFHNAYGPDKNWFYDVAQSGGGCVMDLGTHLVDLALWMCGYPAVRELRSRLYRGGLPLRPAIDEVEDAAFAEWTFEPDTSVRLGCSWGISAGCDAVIRAEFYGSDGSLVLRNVDGSFFDFVVEHCRRTEREMLAAGPDSWGGRSLARWIDRLGDDPTFDPAAEDYLQVAALVDGIYAR